MPRFQTLTPTTDHLEKKHYLHAITFLTFILWLQRCAHPKQGSIESPYVVSWRRNIHDYYSLCTLHTFKNKTCFTYVYDQHTQKKNTWHPYLYLMCTVDSCLWRLFFLGVVDWNSAAMLSVPDLNPWPFSGVTWESIRILIPPTEWCCFALVLEGSTKKPTRKNCLYIFIYTVYVICTANRVITCYLPPVTRIKSWSNWGLLLHRSGSSVSAIFNSNVEAMFPSTKTSDPRKCCYSRLESSKHLPCVCVFVCVWNSVYFLCKTPGYWTDSWFIDF